MTPPGWTPYHRPEDGELLGFLQSGTDGTTALTLVGHPLAEPSDREQAEEVLRQRGLAVLAEPWWLVEEDGPGYRVQILSATADSVTVARADYGFVSHDTEHLRLPTSANPRLRPL